MSAEWKATTLGEVLTLQRGFDLPARSRQPGPFPVVSSSGVTGSHSKCKVQPPGVVIGRYGSLGSVHWVTEPFCPLNTALWVKDFKGNDERFVSYLLRTVTMDSSAASAVPGVNRNHLHKLPVRLPDLRTQRRIGALLAAFDELIEINERRSELLEGLGRSLYREWFVHFRFPGHKKAEFVDSELGPIPEGWAVQALGDVAELRYGRALPARSRRPGSVPVVSSAGIIDEHDEALVEGPGVVLGRKGNVGSVWWVDGPFFPIDTTYYLASEISIAFLFWTCRDLDFIDSHAAVPGLSRDQAYSLLITVPPQSLIEQFGVADGALRGAAHCLRDQNDSLIATRDLLLPRLVTGRLDISDIDLGVLTPAEAE